VATKPVGVASKLGVCLLHVVQTNVFL
jgi:hypothetical protein